MGRDAWIAPTSELPDMTGMHIWQEVTVKYKVDSQTEPEKETFCTTQVIITAHEGVDRFAEQPIPGSSPPRQGQRGRRQELA